MVRDVVYFGRNRPDGGTVSDAEWEAYLDSVVTPRFPAGFTVVEAEGHWRGESGVVEREHTEVLTLLHPGDEASRMADDHTDYAAAEFRGPDNQGMVIFERSC